MAWVSLSVQLSVDGGRGGGGGGQAGDGGERALLFPWKQDAEGAVAIAVERLDFVGVGGAGRDG